MPKKSWKERAGQAKKEKKQDIGVLSYKRNSDTKLGLADTLIGLGGATLLLILGKFLAALVACSLIAVGIAIYYRGSKSPVEKKDKTSLLNWKVFTGVLVLVVIFVLAFGWQSFFKTENQQQPNTSTSAPSVSISTPSNNGVIIGNNQGQVNITTNTSNPLPSNSEGFHIKGININVANNTAEGYNTGTNNTGFYINATNSTVVNNTSK